MVSSRWFAAALAITHTVPVVSAKSCPPLGPVLPAPKASSQSDLVNGVAEALKAQLDQMLEASINTSGISIAMKSIHEQNNIFSYHFTPPVLSGIGTAHIDENTIYRVGSVSKLFTAVSTLQLDIDLDASVLEFLPDLGGYSDGNDIETIKWEDITVRSLMSHLSGLPTETSMDLTILSAYPWSKKGLPEVPPSEAANCSGLYSSRPCERADLIAALKRSHSVWLPNSVPVYSNTGFAVLALVVEAVTGRPFGDIVQERVFDVLGMNSTSFGGPIESFSSRGWVPVTEDTWNITLGVDEPAGGLFSTTRDMLTFLEGVITNGLLSPAKTRDWLKPVSHTTSLSQSVGSPWEILRTDNLTSDGRVIDVYTKSGALGLYSALVGIVPDYDIVFSVMVGGTEAASNPFLLQQLTSIVMKSLVPAIEQTGKLEASNSLVGTYVDTSTNSTLELELDDGPGLRLTRLYMRGYDVLGNMASYTLQSADFELRSGMGIPGFSITVRLYPTNKTNRTGSAGNSTTETSWRAAFDLYTQEQAEQIESTLFYRDATCQTWHVLDISPYNFRSIGEFIFTGDASGTVTQILSPAFNVSLARIQ